MYSSVDLLIDFLILIHVFTALGSIFAAWEMPIGSILKTLTYIVAITCFLPTCMLIGFPYVLYNTVMNTWKTNYFLNLQKKD